MSGGTTCPLCLNYASLTRKDKLYRHRGDAHVVIGPGYRECRASGRTYADAQIMRRNKAEGRHPQRNADGTWLPNE